MSELPNLPKLTQSGYRADIDGLRAISIVLVLAFHAFPGLAPGGFIGVDVFFVISGFLITKIIVSENAAGRFSLRSFYERRIKRIFPALIVVTAATYAIGWAVLLPGDFVALGKNVLASVFFASNLLQLQAADYFTPDAATNPLLHLWSLGIEEQFYIFWPLFLVTITRRSGARLIVLALGLGSLAASIFLTAHYQKVAFYSPISRAWELLGGALLAQFRLARIDRSSPLISNLKAAAGLGLILAGALLLDRHSSFPGWNALMPVAGACLLLDSSGSALNRMCLASRPMVAIGLISYPLYLWHWPLLTYLNIVKAGTPTDLENGLAIVAAVILATLTFRWIELPSRSSRLGRPFTLAAKLASIGVVGLITVGLSGMEFRFPPAVRAIASVHIDPTSFRPECFLTKEQDSSAFSPECIEPGDGPLVVLWGDSTAAALYPGLKSLQAIGHFRVAQFTAAGCSPLIGLGGTSDEHCAEISSNVLDRIADLKPAIVMMQGVWELDDVQRLRETIDRLHAIGVSHPVVLGKVPTWGRRGLPQIALNWFRLRRKLIPDRLRTEDNGPEIESAMEPAVVRSEAEYVSIRRALCNNAGCITRTGPSGADLIAADWVHLTKSGSIFLFRLIRDQLAMD